MNENHESKNTEIPKSLRTEHVRSKLKNRKEISKWERDSDIDRDEDKEWNHHTARNENMISGSESETDILSDTSSL